MTEHLQSVYKANNYTETALLKVREDILQAITHRKVTCLVLLDLSVAFDTVDHQLLLNRLKHRFGVVAKVYDWIKSYLSGQTQQVVVGDIALGGATSSKSKLKQGIPHGSVLGPILFNYTFPHWVISVKLIALAFKTMQMTNRTMPHLNQCALNPEMNVSLI